MSFFEGIKLYIAIIPYGDLCLFLAFIFTCVAGIIFAIFKGGNTSFKKQVLVFFLLMISCSLYYAYSSGSKTTMLDLERAYVEGNIGKESLNELIFLVKKAEEENKRNGEDNAEQRRAYFQSLIKK